MVESTEIDNKLILRTNIYQMMEYQLMYWRGLWFSYKNCSFLFLAYTTPIWSCIALQSVTRLSPPINSAVKLGDTLETPDPPSPSSSSSSSSGSSVGVVEGIDVLKL